MSRIGKKPIEIPGGVKVALADNEINVQGPKGNLKKNIPAGVAVEVDTDQIRVLPPENPRETTAMQGLTRTIIANMVDGVTEGFKKTLEIKGVGYRAEMKGKILNLALGYSHPIEYPLPEGISAEVDPKANTVVVEGIDKELVGATAAKIRSFREPEPYKGKGIKYIDERIVRKAGKAGKV
ncbi:MAG: 50S ribosomal protein L6 [Desulfuromonas sp.]|nr:MAG: 50S ribosomal protein L6 [Desulfuromonas sp.]